MNIIASYVDVRSAASHAVRRLPAATVAVSREPAVIRGRVAEIDVDRIVDDVPIASNAAIDRRANDASTTVVVASNAPTPAQCRVGGLPLPCKAAPSAPDRPFRAAAGAHAAAVSIHWDCRFPTPREPVVAITEARRAGGLAMPAKAAVGRGAPPPRDRIDAPLPSDTRILGHVVSSRGEAVVV